MEIPKEPKTTATIKQNPADNLAKMVLAAGSAGSIASSMRDILRGLPKHCKSRNTLNAAGLDYVKNQLLTKHQGAIVAMEALLIETGKVANNKVNTVTVMDTTEVYAAGKGKTNGRIVEKYEEIEKESAIFTNDVLQQTPEILELDVDQFHVEHTREQRPTNRNAAGVWDTKQHVIDESSTIEAKTPKGIFTYVFQKEEVKISLKPLEIVVQDDHGKPAALINQDKFAILGGVKMEQKIAYNIKGFKRTGLFGTSDFVPGSVDYITPKIDGEPMYIRVATTGKSFGCDRKGSKFEVKIEGLFEKLGRKARGIKLLTEWVPRIEPGAEVYLTNAWQFGTPNNIGFAYTKKLLERKKIKIVWEAGVYKYDLTKKVNQSEVIVDLKLPVFGKRCDGLVVHKGMNQRFLKPYRTVDVKKQATHDTLVRDFGVTFDHFTPGIVCEYAVHADGEKIRFKKVKERKDKHQENDIDNIIDLITNADFDTWFDELAERMDNGSLVKPEGWERYQEFIEKRNRFKFEIYAGQLETEDREARNNGEE
jgi:hypothetical protein